MSKAAKRKGRARKTGNRHPGGKLVQPTPKIREDAMMSVVIDARMRIYGLSETVARSVEASEALGRLYISREISRTQYEDGCRYAEIVHAHRAAIEARGLPSPGDLNRTRGHDSREGDDPSYVSWCRRAVEQYRQVRRAVVESPDPLAQAVLDGVVIDGREMPTYVGTLRIALNAVGHAINSRRAA